MDAKRLFALVDVVKGSSEGTNPKAETKNQTTSNPAKLKAGDPVWPSDSKEDDDLASLIQAGYRADDINLDEIPF